MSPYFLVATTSEHCSRYNPSSLSKVEEPARQKICVTVRSDENIENSVLLALFTEKEGCRRQLYFNLATRKVCEVC